MPETNTRGATATGGPAPPLRGRVLTVARVAWISVTVLTVGLFVAGLPAQYEQLATPCAACANEQLPRGAIQALEERGLSLASYALFSIVRDILFVSVWLVAAALIFWRRSQDRAALVVSFFFVTFGVGTFTDTLNALANAYPAWESVVRGLEALGVASLVVALFLFPDGRFVPRWTRFFAFAFVLLHVVGLLFPGIPLGPNSDLVFIVVVLLFVMIAATQVYRYRWTSGLMERQQTKWAVFGIAAALVGFFVLIGLTFIIPAINRSGTLSSIAFDTAAYVNMVLIPLSFGVAILRSRLWDIDVLINRTLVYGTLTAALATVYAGTVVLLQAALRSLTGGESQLAIVASTLAVAALFNPLRRRIQSVIDRRFYRRKYDATKTLQAFSAKLRKETDLETLNAELIAVVRETMQPQHVSLWLREPGSESSDTEKRQ
ncbi:MAG: hypothetical protein ACFB50_15410 [Rubrobacteraceae bacterium]